MLLLCLLCLLNGGVRCLEWMGSVLMSITTSGCRVIEGDLLVCMECPLNGLVKPGGLADRLERGRELI